MTDANGSVAIFINVDVDDSVRNDPEVAKRLAEACPVDIFARDESGGVEIVEQNLDECVLCYLCVEAAPENTVRIIKLYE
jgi:NAD-dependent dihydropyrimidine dehydrogenase PreA subunit